MKKLNKIINFLLIFTLLFSHIPIAKAAGSANVSFSGASSATVGTNIEITMVINNINGAKAIQSFGGILEYDDTYLQYVSFAKIVDFSSGKYNETSKNYLYMLVIQQSGQQVLQIIWLNLFLNL